MNQEQEDEVSHLLEPVETTPQFAAVLLHLLVHPERTLRAAATMEGEESLA